MNLIASPNAPSNEIIMLASQMLYSREPREGAIEVLTRIPLPRFYELFISASDDIEVHSLLTLFTNVVALGDEQVSMLLTPEALSAFYRHVMGSRKPEIRHGAFWCLWNILRFSRTDQQRLIYEFQNGELFDALLDSFETDNLDFIKKVLIPSLISFIRRIQMEGLCDVEVFKTVLDSIEPKLTKLCYREDSPEIESLATSCLKTLFPLSYERERFL
jgi:hypothetical protein